MIRFRNRLYDKSLLKIHSLPSRVISVGNITVGGTGKTPLVQFLAEKAAAKGRKPAVVARGYKGISQDGRTINDEGMMLLKALPDLILVQDPDRVSAARTASTDLGADFLIMDDGFQHRRLHRDLDILVVDATCPFGNGRVLPAGLLREPLSGLKRARALVMTRCDQVEADNLDHLEAFLRDEARGASVFRTAHAPLHLRSVDNTQRYEIGELEGRKVFVFCAIANPAAFEHTVNSLGAAVKGRFYFPDHHTYLQQDWERVKGKAEECHAEWAMTTAKDGVKLSSLEGAGNVLILEVGIRFLNGGDEFLDLVFRKKSG